LQNLTQDVNTIDHLAFVLTLYARRGASGDYCKEWSYQTRADAQERKKAMREDIRTCIPQPLLSARGCNTLFRMHWHAKRGCSILESLLDFLVADDGHDYERRLLNRSSIQKRPGKPHCTEK
ncbi:hypothetical protein KCU93_g505, partial [Aureobasidium melanogenum]